MNFPDYKTKYFMSLPEDTWVDIRSIPAVIGFCNFCDAIGSRLLKDYGYQIVTNKYFTKFKIEKIHDITKTLLRQDIKIVI